MLEHQLQAEVGGFERSLLRGTVAIVDDGAIMVRVPQGQEDVIVSAALLVTSALPVPLRVGDAVLCFAESCDVDHLLIIGRIDGPRGPGKEESPPRVAAGASGDVADSLVLEAKESLTIRVGDGSITLRQDGKVLIKGKDLVSHAQRVNRIKGGSVAIN